MSDPSEAAKDNACRYHGAPGHIESWFIRANDPGSPRALWLRLTLLAPLSGPPVAQSWFAWFDGDRVLARKETVPFEGAAFDPPGVAGCRFELGAPGSARGTVGPYGYALEWPAASDAPLHLYPFAAMYRGSFPRSKPLTPWPSLRLSGEVRLEGQTVRIDGWRGAQGHNWGSAHAYEYTWGQCQFDDETVVEMVSSRLRIAGRFLPRMSTLVVQRAGEELRFDRLFDFYRQQAVVGERRIALRLEGRAGRVRLEIDAKERPMVCLGYANPDGSLAYCFNTKLAEAQLEVEPRRGTPFRCRSDFGAALEVLRSAPQPGVPVI